VIASLADADIRSASAQDPLFLWLAPFAPHGPSTPAPRDDGSLSGIEPWRPPSYNESDMRDKPAYMQSLPSLSVDDEATLDASREDQLESLGAVDDAVGVVTQALAETGRLSDTIIVFASDNGYMWGEHRRIGKIVPYEESVRIPLVIRWDRLATPPTTNKRLVSNVDLAPTLEQAASADVLPADGRSLLPLLRRQRVTWRQHLLIEHSGPEPQPIYCADRTPSDILIHYATGEEEYYRLGPKADPYQLINKISKLKFASRIATLRTKLRTMCTPLPPGMPAF
jgi:N-acetylglucosamine-6-sulfatase